MSDVPGAHAPQTMETPLARVHGLGAAREGAEHWWHERLTSIASLLLFVWLLVSLLRLPALDHGTLVEWLAQPLAAVPMLLLIFTTFWHAKMGLQVIVEDYVHEEGGKLFWIVLINFAAVLAGGLAMFAVLKIALGGSAG
ncbi:MAG TPA: succinate dehydrogenase, hydrophobic membrane anchor protein [Allosphingosinicella sp.]|nr:succinate dehydrogenase, hydrophobic membrane anchor protein [Allosphingosinicella sp.]